MDNNLNNNRNGKNPPNENRDNHKNRDVRSGSYGYARRRPAAKPGENQNSSDTAPRPSVRMELNGSTPEIIGSPSREAGRDGGARLPSRRPPVPPAARNDAASPVVRKPSKPAPPQNVRPAYNISQDFRSIDYDHTDADMKPVPAAERKAIPQRLPNGPPSRDGVSSRDGVAPYDGAAHQNVMTAKNAPDRKYELKRRAANIRRGRKLNEMNRRVRRGGGGGGYGEAGSFLSSILKAVVYIVFIFAASIFISYNVIVIGNDVFAFVKSTDAVDVTVPEYATVSDISELLYQKSIIKYPSVFQLYAKLRKKDNVEFVAGAYSVTPSMSYDELIAKFRKTEQSSRKEIRITIPEGDTIDEIIDLLLSYGIGTKEGFVDVIQNGEFDFWFMDHLKNLSPDRTYRLEGYLFPDTYYFYTDSSERTVVYKMLYRFNEVFDERYKESCTALGMSVDEVVTLASMIQSESKHVEEYGSISSVFHNRLNNPSYETQGYLSSDATIQYILPSHKTVLTNDDTMIDNPYNTYKHKGVPPGPICNPSLNAMSYALYPDATSYYYFVAQTNGYSLFAKTSKEQLANIKIARGG